MDEVDPSSPVVDISFKQHVRAIFILIEVCLYRYSCSFHVVVEPTEPEERNAASFGRRLRTEAL